MTFEPKTIVIDFEKAIHTACENVWPGSELVGCRFHLTQAWIRKIQKHHLKKDYEEKTEIGNWLGLCFGLLFFNPEDVSDVFTDDLMSIKPNNLNLTQFADYLVNEYIAEDAVFPPHIWARCSADIHLTTNACESFHGHLSKHFNSSHPNIHVFIDALLNIQRNTYIQINSLREIATASRSGKTKRQKYSKAKVEELKSGFLSNFEFLEKVSWYYRHVKK